ncbi:hypothetical protein SAY87_005603 [Trapa incisa]|uniref:Uncharacterized protein n=1 Tax=Trapa incisa TaxID=236973 RepID=A0AAN7K518_9MYRT|nr:hypothetical protein SAY87_005603 [Trapa incisa]
MMANDLLVKSKAGAWENWEEKERSIGHNTNANYLHTPCMGDIRFPSCLPFDMVPMPTICRLGPSDLACSKKHGFIVTAKKQPMGASVNCQSSRPSSTSTAVLDKVQVFNLVEVGTPQAIMNKTTCI